MPIPNLFISVLVAIVLQRPLQSPSGLIQALRDGSIVSCDFGRCVGDSQLEHVKTCRWDSMTAVEREALVHCYANGGEWFGRKGRQSLVPSDINFCDTVMENLHSGQWHWAQLGNETRNAIGTCISDRAVMDGMRRGGGAHTMPWLSQDLLYNAYRPYVLGTDLLRMMLVIWQWHSDNRESPDIWLSLRYETHWQGLGLNVSHYGPVRESLLKLDALDTFRLQHNLRDYMEWNDALQQLPLAHSLLEQFPFLFYV